MRRIVQKSIVGFSLVGVMAFVAASGIFLVSSDASAACVTKYKTECVETDDKGKCKRYERVSYEECTEDKKPIHVSPPKHECFECVEHNNDGSCRKTKKVSC